DRQPRGLLCNAEGSRVPTEAPVPQISDTSPQPVALRQLWTRVDGCPRKRRRLLPLSTTNKQRSRASWHATLRSTRCEDQRPRPSDLSADDRRTAQSRAVP